MDTKTLNHAKMVHQLEEELKLLQFDNSIEMGLSDLLGNEGKFCTMTKECMPSCN